MTTASLLVDYQLLGELLRHEIDVHGSADSVPARYRNDTGRGFRSLYERPRDQSAIARAIIRSLAERARCQTSAMRCGKNR